MIINQTHIQEFELGLNPQYPEQSKIPANIVGFGEISSIFKIKPYQDWFFKRLPLFHYEAEASVYIEKHNQYTKYLKQAGLKLPPDDAFVIKSEKVILYLAQKAINKSDLCQNRLHTLPEKEALEMIGAIFVDIKKIADFNENNQDIKLSIDEQVSNWALVNNDLFYFDTSTPKALRWIIRKFFLQEVMDRYYDLRLIYIDLIANLYKEQKSDFIKPTVDLANELLPESLQKIAEVEVEKYYKNDKLIWQLFLSFRKIDRWYSNHILRKQYEFILPGNIKR